MMGTLTLLNGSGYWPEAFQVRGQSGSFHCHTCCPTGKVWLVLLHFTIFISLKKMLPSYYFHSPLASFPEWLVCSLRDFFVRFSKRTLKVQQASWKTEIHLEELCVSLSFSLHVASHPCLRLLLTASWLSLTFQFPFSHHSDREHCLWCLDISSWPDPTWPFSFRPPQYLICVFLFRTESHNRESGWLDPAPESITTGQSCVVKVLWLQAGMSRLLSLVEALAEL